MKRMLLGLGVCLAVFSAKAQSNYSAEIYTSVTKNDQIKVKVELPSIQGEKIYSFPKVVPGTYSVADYGKFVAEFKAINEAGAEVSSTKLNVNQYQLSGDASAVEYWRALGWGVLLYSY